MTPMGVKGGSARHWWVNGECHLVSDVRGDVKWLDVDWDEGRNSSSLIEVGRDTGDSTYKGRRGKPVGPNS